MRAKSISPNNENLNLAIRPDIPGRNRTRNAHYQRTQQSRTKSCDREIIKHRSDEPKHPGIDHEQEQAQRQNRNRQRQHDRNGPNYRVNGREQYRGENNAARPFNFYTRNNSGSEQQPEHRNQRANEESLHPPIMRSGPTLC